MQIFKFFSLSTAFAEFPEFLLFFFFTILQVQGFLPSLLPPSSPLLPIVYCVLQQCSPSAVVLTPAFCSLHGSWQCTYKQLWEVFCCPGIFNSFYGGPPFIQVQRGIVQIFFDSWPCGPLYILCEMTVLRSLVSSSQIRSNYHQYTGLRMTGAHSVMVKIP